MSFPTRAYSMVLDFEARHSLQPSFDQLLQLPALFTYPEMCCPGYFGDLQTSPAFPICLLLQCLGPAIVGALACKIVPRSEYDQRV